MVLVSGLQSPVNAAVVGAYDASDFVRAQIANGNDLKVFFSFDSIIPEFGYIRNGETLGYIRPSAITTNGRDTVYSASVTTPADTKDFLIRMFMAGYRSWANTPASASGCIYVGDIVPGSPLDVTCGYKWHTISSPGSSYPFNDIQVTFRIGMYYYDSDGVYLGRYMISEEVINYAEGNPGTYYAHDLDVDHEWTMEANVSYIAPFYDIDVVWPGGASEYSEWTFNLTAYPFTLTATKNMIYENSQTMGAINDQLGEIQDQLDDLITGGEEGAALGDAGASLDGSSASGSGAADSLSGDINGVSDFESDLMGSVSSGLSGLDISGVGSFAPSLQFISGYVEDIFWDLEDWQIAITLPLFLGLFFGVCQHVGGVTSMRARHASNQRSSELHQARLDKIRKGG